MQGRFPAPDQAGNTVSQIPLPSTDPQRSIARGESHHVPMLKIPPLSPSLAKSFSQFSVGLVLSLPISSSEALPSLCLKEGQLGAVLWSGLWSRV